jgi:hypothetical protein
MCARHILAITGCVTGAEHFLSTPEPYANDVRVIHRSKDFAGALSFTSLCAIGGKKGGGVVLKEKATRVLFGGEPPANECVSEREKEEKANLIKLMQRTNRRPQTHLTKFYIIISLSVWVRACVLLAFCELRGS